MAMVLVLAVIGVVGLAYFAFVGLALSRFVRDLVDAIMGGPPR